jgi:hypothetical protein
MKLWDIIEGPWLQKDIKLPMSRCLRNFGAAVLLVPLLNRIDLTSYTFTVSSCGAAELEFLKNLWGLGTE